MSDALSKHLDRIALQELAARKRVALAALNLVSKCPPAVVPECSGSRA